MKKFLLVAALLSGLTALAFTVPVFPEKMIHPMVGFEKWQCGKEAVTAVQTRKYSYTTAIALNTEASKLQFFKVKLESAEDIKGNLTIYFNNGGRRFQAGNFFRKKFVLKANTPQEITIALKGKNWQGKIGAFRFDISGKKGLSWKIHKVWFTGSGESSGSAETSTPAAAPDKKVMPEFASKPLPAVKPAPAVKAVKPPLNIFPGKKIYGAVGFKSFKVQNGAIHAEQSRAYSYTSTIPLGINGKDYKYLHCLVETPNDISGKFTLYFMRKGEKRFASGNYLRHKFAVAGGKKQLISMPLSGKLSGWLEKIRLDFSTVPGQKWIIHKIWFGQDKGVLFNNHALNSSRNFAGDTALVETRYDLLEGREYRFAFDIDGKGCKAMISAHYYDDIGKFLGKSALAEAKQGKAELLFTPPESVTKVNIVMTLQGRGKVHNFQLGETGKRGGAVWQASWIRHPELRRTAGYSIFLFSKEFELDSLPVDARIQLTADDGYNLKINGKSIGQRPGGWQQTALYDVTDALKVGKNILEVAVNNDNGPYALIAELRCDMADGRVIVIKSDRTFVVQQLEGQGKKVAPAAAQELGIPPVAPWHCVAYNMLPKRETLKVKENTLRCRDGKISGQVRFEKCERSTLPLLISFEGGTAGKYVVPVKDSVMNVDIDINKTVLLPGDYTLVVDNLGVKGVRELLKFNVPARKKAANIHVRMAQNNGQLQVMLDGKPFLFSGFRARRQTQRERAYQDGNYRIMLFGVARGGFDGSNSGATWLGPGRHSFENIDAALDTFVRTFPEAYLIITCGIDAPRWWTLANPGECVWFENSPKPEGLTSLASAKWRREGCEALRELIRHLEKSPHASRIIGYRIQAHSSGGEFQYLGTWQRKFADYSPAMQRYFRRFLAARYGSDAKLQKAWNDPKVTLKTAKIPTGQERRKRELMVFRDLDKARSVADYTDCHSDAMVTGAMEFLKVVREEAPNKLSGLYGGYVFYYSSFQLLTSAHSNFGKLYRSRLADFICSPHDYIQRKVGWPGSHHGPATGTGLYNLLWWDENDTRTIMCAPGGQRHVNSMLETIGVLKRDLILQVTKGLGNMFYDLAGGWFDHPGIMEALRKTNQIGRFALTLPNFRRGQVAVLYSTESIKRLSMGHSVITDPVRTEFRRNLGWSGVTADLYLLEDILQDNFPEYDCYILPNVYAPGDKVRKAIKKKLMKPGKLVIFGYAPGAFREKSGKIDVPAMKELTGMDFKSEMRQINRLAKVGNVTIGSGVKFGPLFYISDSKAEVLGRYSNTALPAVARKKLANGTTVVATMLPEMTAELWREIFRQHKMHIFCESSDPVYYDGRFIAIHANSDGKKTLKLPEAVEWFDLFRCKKVSGKSGSFTLDMVRGETEIFFVGSEKDFRRYVKMEEKR